MQYPLVLKAFKNGVKLYIPDPLLVKPTYESLRLEHPATSFPFWAKVWPSAVALSSFLEQYQDLIKNKTVVEIGAGIGLPSFSIADHVAEITITDYDVDAIDLLQKNIAHLGNQKIKAICADWNYFPTSICADVVLLSDTNYAPSAFESLLTLIQKFLQKGATIIIATPIRITASPFIEQLEMHITQRDLIELSYNGESSIIGLVVLK
ncbi:MAG: class I SAM-dependent methyltransferase [Sediminibacterium sp.]